MFQATSYIDNNSNNQQQQMCQLRNHNHPQRSYEDDQHEQLLCLSAPPSTQQAEAYMTPYQSKPASMMHDPVYLYDEHVLDRMLASEKRQNILSYFVEFDNNNKTNHSAINNNKYHHQQQQRLLDFDESDRRALAVWMFQVCLDEKCQPDVFPLSIFIVDKFLYFVKQTKRKQLQLLGSVALLLASKLRQTIQIQAKQLIYYTQELITMQELKTWEFFVLTTLKWDLNLITPVDYLDILLNRLTTINDEQIISDIEERAHKLIIQCCFDFKHSSYKPSMIAWACFLQALELCNINPDKTIDYYTQISTKISIDSQLS